MGATRFPIIGKTNEQFNHQDSQDILATNASNELVFAVVGHVGSGTSEVAEALEDVLKGLKEKPFDTTIIKARDLIVEWATLNGFPVGKHPRTH
jgi:hypothetical protein